MSLRSAYWALTLLFTLLLKVPVASAQMSCSELFLVGTQQGPWYETFSDTQLKQTISQNQAEIKSLQDPTDALLAKLMLIRRAKVSIDLSYYIFKRDQTGYLVLNELKEALKRGVKVRVLIDSVGSMHLTHTELLALFQVEGAKGNIEIATINPPMHFARFLRRLGDLFRGKWDSHETDGLLRFNNRSHDKILMIDSGTPNMMSVVGGRNIGNDYYGLNEDDIAIRDFEVLIRPRTQNADSSLDTTLSRYYNMLFFHRNNKMLSERLYRLFNFDYSKEIAKMETAQSDLMENTRWRGRLERMEKENYLENGFENASMRFVHDAQNLVSGRKFFSGRWSRWQKRANPNSLNRSFLERLLEAKTSIDLVSPYPILTKRDIRMIEKWLLQNPNATFSLYANSTSTNDIPMAQAVFDQFVAKNLMALKENPMIGDRIRIYSYFGQMAPNESWLYRLFGIGPSERIKGRLMHAKIILIDGKEFLVSTSNFDPRSRLHNSEMGLWIDQENVGQVNDAQKYIDDLRASSQIWGSPEWNAQRRKPLGIEASVIQRYMHRLIEALNITTLL